MTACLTKEKRSFGKGKNDRLPENSEIPSKLLFSARDLWRYFSKKSPAASSTYPASSVLKTPGPLTERTYYCRLSNEYITLSSASFTNSAISMSGSIAKRALFRSVFSIYIALKHLITFKGMITEILSQEIFLILIFSFLD